MFRAMKKRMQEKSSMSYLNNQSTFDELKKAVRSMKKITFVLIIISLFITSHTNICEAGYEVTIGSQFTIEGSGFGSKKPKVYVEYEGRQAKAKIESWGDTSITALWKKKISPGTYNLFVQPKIKGADPISMGTVSIVNPSIDEVISDTGSSGETATVNGKFFTTKKPKVYLIHKETSQTKKCKVTSSTMNVQTGESTLQFVIPADNFSEQTLVLITKIGEAEFDFAEPEPAPPAPDPEPNPDPNAPTPEPTEPGVEEPIPEPSDPGAEGPTPEPTDPGTQGPTPEPSDPGAQGPIPVI
jgi:hypothetical protein